MVRRLLWGGFGIVGALVVAAVVWQPRALQWKVVSLVADKISETTPYDIEVGDVSGNFFRSFSLKNIRIRAEGGRTDLVTAADLRVGLRWRALLHRRLEVKEIRLDHPVVRLTIGPDKKLELPIASASPKKKPASGAFPLFVDKIEIRDGRLVLRNRSLSPPAELNVEPISLQASLVPDALSISTLELGLDSGQASASGRIGRVKPFPVELHLRTRAFPFHVALAAAMARRKPLFLTHSGVWTVTGQGQKWNVTSDGRLDGSRLRVTAALDTRGPYRASVRLDPLSLGNLWRDPVVARLGILSANVDAAGPAPASKAVNVSGDLHLEAPSRGGRPSPEVAVHLDLVRGRGEVLAAATAEGLRLGTTMQLNLPASRLQGPFDLVLSNFVGLSEWAPVAEAASGTVRMSGSVQGPFTDLAIQARLHGQALSFQTKALESLDVTAQGGLGAKDAVTLHGTLANLLLNKDRPSPWDATSAEIKAQGPPARLKSHLSVHFRNAAVFQLTGLWQRLVDGWRVDWDRLALTPANAPAFVSTSPGFIQSSTHDGIEVQNLALANGAGTIEIPETLFHDGNLKTQLVINNLSLPAVARMVNPAQKLDGSLNADIQLAGALRSPSGHVQLQWSHGTVHGFSFKDLSVGAQLAPPWITVHPLLLRMQNAQDDIHGGGRLPMHLMDPSQPDLPADFTLQARRIDIRELAAAYPELIVAEKGGAAAFSVSLRGRYPALTIDGKLTAQIPRLLIKPAGLELRDLKADVRSHDKTVEVRQFIAKTKKGHIEIAGKSTLPDLHFTVQGKDVVLNIPKQLQAKLDLAVLVSGDLEGPDLSGDVAIDNATYTRPKKTKKDREKEKAAQAQKEEEERVALTQGGRVGSPVWQGTTMNVHVQWPRNVWYRDGLSKIETSGDLWVKKDEHTEMPYFAGSITVVRGTYDAFGRDFVLNSGSLMFTGTPELNPALNVEAQYSSGGTVVYLDVTGTAKQPNLTLRSNPPLSEQDIISVLVLGQPLNQVGPGQTSETSKSQQAAALAGSVVGSYLTKELRESGMDFVGLDVVRVEPTTGGNRLTVGRYIGSKLFVSYGQPLQSGADRVFDANYYLNKFLTLLGETGTLDSHMDLQVRVPLNQPPAPPPAVKVPKAPSPAAGS